MYHRSYKFYIRDGRYREDIEFYKNKLTDSMLDNEELVLDYSSATLIINFDQNYVKRELVFKNKKDCILFKMKYGL